MGISAFGLGLLTDLDPPGAWEAQTLSEPLLRLESATSEAIETRWSGVEEVGWEGTIDGFAFLAERGLAGDHRFVHAERPGRSVRAQSIYHLSANGGELRCAPSDPTDPSWWRVVLDSVLFSAALLHGYEALHAGALTAGDGVIAITAGSGGGKSTLVSELLRRGLTLMADDVLVLERTPGGGPPLAHPAPPLMTVPTERVASLREGLASKAPQTIAVLEQEHWVAVPVHDRPLPLRDLIVLNRRPGVATSLRRVERPLAALIESLLRFPRTRERERARFELAGAIAAHVAIWELAADPSVEPAALADLVLGEAGVTATRDVEVEMT
jgi:hypothetical protein